MVGDLTQAGTARPRLRRTEKVSQSVAREIVRTIVEERLEPGSVLPAEAEMVHEFGVGRASLREALRLLEVQGLVAMKPGPGGGPVVGAADATHFGRMATLFFQLAGATFADLLEARIALEPMMVHQLTEAQDPDLIGVLEGLLGADLEDERSYVERAVGFHDLIASSTKNPVLNLVSSAIIHCYAARVPGASFPAGRRHEVVNEHLAILRAVVGRRPDEAEALMRQHMESTRADVLARYPGLLDELVGWD
ncbi:FadR/GntR family transcriptional regulator [Intrasporangium mesophilum]